MEVSHTTLMDSFCIAIKIGIHEAEQRDSSSLDKCFRFKRDELR